MITPVDIQNKEFPKKMSGYDRLLVDEFMLEVSDAYEKIYRENIDLKDKLSNLNESLRKYIAMEDSMQTTLRFAQNTADDVKKSATEKAELLVKEAELKASQITTDAQNKVLEQERKLEELKKLNPNYVQSEMFPANTKIFLPTFDNEEKIIYSEKELKGIENENFKFVELTAEQKALRNKVYDRKIYISNVDLSLKDLALAISDTVAPIYITVKRGENFVDLKPLYVDETGIIGIEQF